MEKQGMQDDHLNALPSPLSSTPRVPLLYLHPSPIEPLPRLTLRLFQSNSCTTDSPDPNSQEPDDLIAAPKLWIKREDSNSGLAGGGNKVRKLEYVVADALAQNATVLVTIGGLQSNHMRQTAAVGAKLGLKTHLIPQDRGISHQQEYKTLGNIQITHLLSATHEPHDSAPEDVMQSLRESGEVPYWIPSGASMHPLGGLGFARFAFELSTQETSLDIFFDTIIVACASGSTLGGMIAGFKLLSQLHPDSEQDDKEASRTRKIIGIDCFANPPGESSKRILEIARTTASKIGLSSEDIQAEDVIVDERWNAGKYGFVDGRTQDAVKLAAKVEGVLLDPVYTGKAMAGLVGRAELGEFKGARNILFVHTGGSYALSAYPDVK